MTDRLKSRKIKDVRTSNNDQWPVGQVAKTLPFHGGIESSILSRAIQYPPKNRAYVRFLLHSMAFVDKSTIEVKSGKGGDGQVSFRREKFVDKGGPFGGDGGKGGSVVFVADEGLRTLMDFRYNRHFKAPAGGNGATKGMTGKSADDLRIKVPLGTLVYDEQTNQLLADMYEHGQEYLVVKGGRGGRGNMRFATPANPAPEISENGEPAITKKIKLELKVLADVGLVGFPSAGKSTFLSVVSNATPKIADYHFTTLSPNLGMVKLDDGKDFVIADLPGLIEGASQGAGLGLEFLRHIERTRVILHLVDITSNNGLEFEPYEAYAKILNELKEYDEALLLRPQIVVATKMDLPEANEKFEEFKKAIQDNPILDTVPTVMSISAVTGDGVSHLLQETAKTLEEIPINHFEVVDDNHQLYTLDQQDDFEVQADPVGEGWIIVGQKIEKIFAMTNKNHDQSLRRFARQMKTMGVDDALRAAGAEPGDDVRINDSDFVFEFEE